MKNIFETMKGSMNRQKLMSLLLLAAMPAGAQRTFSISGTIPGMPDSAEVDLVITEGQQPKKLTGSPIKDGRFVLTGEYAKPYLCSMNFYVPGKKGKSKVCAIRVMLDSHPLTFIADTAAILNSSYNVFAEEKATFEGSPVQSQYMEFLNATRSLEHTSDSAGYAQAEAWFNNSGDEDAIAGHKQRAAAAAKAYEEGADRFLMSHPDYYPTAALLAQRIYSDFTYTAAQYDAWLGLLQNNPDTAHVNFIRRNIDVAKKYAVGAMYTDFSGKQPDNTTAKLSSLMKPGKYTLIDFWASWCGPCRAAIPKVKKMAEDYKDVLQVISASVDEKEDAWCKAEQAENMPWPQLLLTGDEYGKAGMAYMIQSIPRLVLIAPDGGILIATFDPNAIREKLKEQTR